MMFGAGIINGVTVGIEFFWEDASLCISLGIIRLTWCWNLAKFIGEEDE